MVKDEGEGPKPIWKTKGLRSFLGGHEMSLEGWVARPAREKDAHSPEHEGCGTLQQKGRQGREATKAGKVERNRHKGLVYPMKKNPQGALHPLGERYSSSRKRWPARTRGCHSRKERDRNARAQNEGCSAVEASLSGSQAG